MKTGFAKKSISFNLLSLSGYICLLMLLYTVIEEIYLRLHPDGYVSPPLLRFVFRWYYPFLVQAGLTMLAIIEFIFYKRGKSLQINTSKIHPTLIKIHPYVFWLGVFFIFIPIYWLVFILGIHALNAIK